MKKLLSTLVVLGLSTSVLASDLYSLNINPRKITVAEVSDLFSGNVDTTKSEDKIVNFVINMHSIDSYLLGMKTSILTIGLDDTNTTAEFNCINDKNFEDIKQDIIKKYKQGKIKGNEDFTSIFLSYLVSCFSEPHVKRLKNSL